MLCGDILWEKIDIFVLRELIEDAVEHRANIVLAIVDDLFCLFVPKHRNSDSLLKISIGRSVGFAQITKTIDWIGRFKLIEILERRAWLGAFRIAESPTSLVAERIDNRHADSVFEAF